MTGTLDPQLEGHKIEDNGIIESVIPMQPSNTDKIDIMISMMKRIDEKVGSVESNYEQLRKDLEGAKVLKKPMTIPELQKSYDDSIAETNNSLNILVNRLLDYKKSMSVANLSSYLETMKKDSETKYGYPIIDSKTLIEKLEGFVKEYSGIFQNYENVLKEYDFAVGKISDQTTKSNDFINTLMRKNDV